MIILPSAAMRVLELRFLYTRCRQTDDDFRKELRLEQLFRQPEMRQPPGTTAPCRQSDFDGMHRTGGGLELTVAVSPVRMQ
jgi:hypothetical protein